MDLIIVISEMFRQTISFRLTWMGPHSNMSFLVHRSQSILDPLFLCKPLMSDFSIYYKMAA